MTERVMSINAVPSFIVATLRANRVRVSEADSVITIVPAEDAKTERRCCPLLGIAKDSCLTIDKFLEWKREDREREYEQELHS